jgi:hypothetical protein
MNVKSNMDNKTDEIIYLSPVAVVLQMSTEGVLCSSSNTESFDENGGIW